MRKYFQPIGSDRFVHYFTLFELNANTIIVTSTIQKHHEVCFLLPHRDSHLLNAAYIDTSTRSPHATICWANLRSATHDPAQTHLLVMAALVADVTRVESLAEQFGRQRLEEGLAHRAESLSSQLSVDNNAPDVKFLPHHSAWLICERAPSKSKQERHTNQGIKQYKTSRNLQHLNDRESPQLVSEVRIVKVNNKRNFKRTQAVKPSRGEKEYALDKEKLNTVCNEEGEGLDLSSSSDDELRELFLCEAKPAEMDSTRLGKAGGAEDDSARPTGLLMDQISDKSDTRRKRNKICRGSLKKKIKISRPCLDLEKMLARRLEDLKTDNKKPENIFHPIHQM